jgi:hypothetical protein
MSSNVQSLPRITEEPLDNICSDYKSHESGAKIGFYLTGMSAEEEIIKEWSSISLSLIEILDIRSIPPRLKCSSCSNINLNVALVATSYR